MAGDGATLILASSPSGTSPPAGVATGNAAKGVYMRSKPPPQYVNKVNLEEIHRLTMGYLKRERVLQLKEDAGVST